MSSKVGIVIRRINIFLHNEICPTFSQYNTFDGFYVDRDFHYDVPEHTEKCLECVEAFQHLPLYLRKNRCFPKSPVCNILFMA